MNSQCVKSCFPLKNVESYHGTVDCVVFFLRLASSLAKFSLDVHCPWGTFRPAEGSGPGALSDLRSGPVPGRTTMRPCTLPAPYPHHRSRDAGPSMPAAVFQLQVVYGGASDLLLNPPQPDATPHHAQLWWLQNRDVVHPHPCRRAAFVGTALACSPCAPQMRVS